MFGRKADSQAEPAAVQGFDDFEVRLGDVMRGERATKGKSLLDVQRDLRIRAAYIAAIENCDMSAFDTPSFVSGYVRGYARYLGMEPEETFRQFCIESGFQPPHGMAPAAAGTRPVARLEADGLANSRTLYLPQPESFWSGIEPRAIGSLMVLLLLVCGLGFGGWAVLQEVQKVSLAPVEDTPGVVTALDPTQEIGEAPSGEVLAIDLPRPDLSDLTFRPQMLETPELPARDSPIAAIDPNLGRPARPLDAPVLAAQAAPVAGAALPEGLAQAMGYGPQQPVTVTATVAAMGMPAAPVLADAGQEGVAILAARAAWVRVTAADGTVLLEKTMDAGERFALPALEAPPLLRAGNSGAVYFAVNGRTYGPAAPGAQVVKQVPLSAEALVERFALADPSKDSDLAQMILVASAEPEADAAPGSE